MFRIVGLQVNYHNNKEIDLVIEAYLGEVPILLFCDYLNEYSIFLSEYLDGNELNEEDDNSIPIEEVNRYINSNKAEIEYILEGYVK